MHLKRNISKTLLIFTPPYMLFFQSPPSTTTSANNNSILLIAWIKTLRSSLIPLFFYFTFNPPIHLASSTLKMHPKVCPQPTCCYPSPSHCNSLITGFPSPILTLSVYFPHSSRNDPTELQSDVFLCLTTSLPLPQLPNHSEQSQNPDKDLYELSNPTTRPASSLGL